MKLVHTFLALAIAAMPLAAFTARTGAALEQQKATGSAPEIKWKAPTRFLSGGAFLVHIDMTAPAGGCVAAGWLLTPAAFTLDGKPLAVRDDKGSMNLPEGAKISADVDLGLSIKASKDFELGFAQGMPDEKPVKITLFVAAGAGLNFMDDKSMPIAELTKYNVLLQTNRGEMIVEFWPEVAPMHVRNFLDLTYTNFYTGTTFHRVGAGFMIQGGDPTGSGNGSGPRQLKAEFNDRKHERGVLSMARAEDPNSASCQFFIMHAATPGLDHQYSVFGRLVAGYETLDLIANAPGVPIPGAGGLRPNETQKILKATVILAAAPAAK